MNNDREALMRIVANVKSGRTQFPADTCAAYRRLRPTVADNMVQTDMAMEQAVIAALEPPFTVEHVAQQLSRSGAFPWDGPVGNGFSLGEYRDRWRQMAREDIQVGQLLGLIPTVGDAA